MEKLIDRPDYLKKLDIMRQHKDLVKILTGVRRCGKSKIFTLFQNHLRRLGVRDDQIININLEDTVQTNQIGLTLNDKKLLCSYQTLLDYVLKLIPTDKDVYIFIDEVQLLEDWQLVANALRLRENADVYLTGSNAYMFSGDLANSFGGRYIEIKVQPFSFKEYCSAFPENKDIHRLYEDYIRESGFPQTLSFNANKDIIDAYLKDTVYLNTVQKDIVKRFNVADTGKLDAVVKYIFANIGSETSLKGIENGLKAGGASVSAPTIDLYIKGLLDSYLVYKCGRYDIKGKQYLNGNSKYYVADIGLRTVLLGRSDTDLGHMLENIVYLELIRRGYTVSTGCVKTKFITENGVRKRKNIEVDFIAKKADQVEYYQVALYALEPETLKRELQSLKEIEDNFPKFILSMDYGSGNTDGIKRVNVLDWLLAQSDEA